MVVDECAVDEIPVDKECTLQGVHHTATQTHVGVAPGQSATMQSLDIAQSYVHSAYESLRAVDDAYLAVVAIVHLTGEGRKSYGHERTHLYACLTHTVEEPFGHSPATYIVVYQAHLYPFARLGNKGITYKTAQRVVGYDVCVKMNVVGGTLYGLQQSRKELIAVGVEFYSVVLKG